MNRLGFNFDVVPSLVQIGRPLIYQESEVHEGTCELKRRSWGYGGAEHGSEIWSKSQRYKEGCYMPVRELGSTSFSVIPVTSPSFPSCLRCSRHLAVTTVSLSYVPSIIVYHHLSVFRLSSFSSLRIYSAPVMLRASFLGFVAALSYFNIFTFLWLDNKFIVFMIL